VAALTDALLALSDEPRHQATLKGLRIRRIAHAEPDAYARILEYGRDAAALGYPDLA